MLLLLLHNGGLFEIKVKLCQVCVSHLLSTTHRYIGSTFDREAKKALTRLLLALSFNFPFSPPRRTTTTITSFTYTHRYFVQKKISNPTTYMHSILSRAICFPNIGGTYLHHLVEGAHFTAAPYASSSRRVSRKTGVLL